MLLGQAYIFVHVECNHIAEAHLASLMQLDEMLVQAQG